LCERTAVVRAGRADREEFVRAADEKDGLAVGVTEQGLAVAHGAGIHSRGKVGPRQLHLLRHGRFLSSMPCGGPRYGNSCSRSPCGPTLSPVTFPCVSMEKNSVAMLTASSDV